MEKMDFTNRDKIYMYIHPRKGLYGSTQQYNVKRPLASINDLRRKENHWNNGSVVICNEGMYIWDDKHKDYVPVLN